LARVRAELIHANFYIVHAVLSLPPPAPDPTASPAFKKSTDYQNPWVERPYLEKVEGVSKQIQPPPSQPFVRSTVRLTRPGDGPAPRGYGPHLRPRTPSPPPRPKFKRRHGPRGKNKNGPRYPGEISIVEYPHGNVQLIDPQKGIKAAARSGQVTGFSGWGGMRGGPKVQVFVRHGSFPLLKLPKELQLMVVDCVLQSGGKEAKSMFLVSREVHNMAELVRKRQRKALGLPEKPEKQKAWSRRRRRKRKVFNEPW